MGNDLHSLSTIVDSETKTKFLLKIREEGYTIQEALALLIERYLKED